MLDFRPTKSNLGLKSKNPRVQHPTLSTQRDSVFSETGEFWKLNARRMLSSLPALTAQKWEERKKEIVMLTWICNVASMLCRYSKFSITSLAFRTSSRDSDGALAASSAIRWIRSVRRHISAESQCIRSDFILFYFICLIREPLLVCAKFFSIFTVHITI